MSNGTISISADDSDGIEEMFAIGIERLRVAFPAEDGYGDTCELCGGTLELVTIDGTTLWQDQDERTYCDNAGDEILHRPDRRPEAWCNSAAIIVDDSENSVTATISIGDPRGGFGFTIRRIPDDSPTEHAGRLVMHLPHPREGMPHATLTELHPGTFLIG